MLFSVSLPPTQSFLRQRARQQTCRWYRLSAESLSAQPEPGPQKEDPEVRKHHRSVLIQGVPANVGLWNILRGVKAGAIDRAARTSSGAMISFFRRREGVLLRSLPNNELLVGNWAYPSMPTFRDPPRRASIGAALAARGASRVISVVLPEGISPKDFIALVRDQFKFLPMKWRSQGNVVSVGFSSITEALNLAPMLEAKGYNVEFRHDPCDAKGGLDFQILCSRLSRKDVLDYNFQYSLSESRRVQLSSIPISATYKQIDSMLMKSPFVREIKFLPERWKLDTKSCLITFNSTWEANKFLLSPSNYTMLDQTVLQAETGPRWDPGSIEKTISIASRIPTLDDAVAYGATRTVRITPSLSRLLLPHDIVKGNIVELFEPFGTIVTTRVVPNCLDVVFTSLVDAATAIDFFLNPSFYARVREPSSDNPSKITIKRKTPALARDLEQGVLVEEPMGPYHSLFGNLWITFGPDKRNPESHDAKEAAECIHTPYCLPDVKSKQWRHRPPSLEQKG
ncbi:hypothetical protein C8J56DRAFT_285912 [Mycena floridula]|nr:hypothetical protein C8J56DRAFT_285912 [Mycena floridula]